MNDKAFFDEILKVRRYNKQLRKYLRTLYSQEVADKIWKEKRIELFIGEEFNYESK